MKNFLLIFPVLLALMPTGAFAKCYGNEYTWNWEDPNNNKNAWGCQCSENNSSYVIHKKSKNTKNFYGAEKAKCAFPNYSLCSSSKWSACSGTWIHDNWKAGVDVAQITSNKHRYNFLMNSGGWYWSCKAGYVLRCNTNGCGERYCILDVAECNNNNGYSKNGECETCPVGSVLNNAKNGCVVTGVMSGGAPSTTGGEGSSGGEGTSGTLVAGGGTCLKANKDRVAEIKALCAGTIPNGKITGGWIESDGCCQYTCNTGYKKDTLVESGGLCVANAVCLYPQMGKNENGETVGCECNKQPSGAPITQVKFGAKAFSAWSLAAEFPWHVGCWSPGDGTYASWSGFHKEEGREWLAPGFEEMPEIGFTAVNYRKTSKGWEWSYECSDGKQNRPGSPHCFTLIPRSQFDKCANSGNIGDPERMRDCFMGKK